MAVVYAHLGHAFVCSQFVHSRCRTHLPCDCNAAWLQDWVRERNDKSENRFMGGIYCVTQDNNQTQNDILHLQKEQFSCGKEKPHLFLYTL